MQEAKCYIDGNWVDSSKRISVENPANLEVLGSVPDLTGADCEAAVLAAEKALPAWRALGGFKRAEYLKKFQARILQRLESDAKILSLENGKSNSEARGEIAYGASYFELYSEEAKRLHGIILGSPVNQQISVTKEAIGVVGLITPWNFPQAMLARKMSAALAAGCTLVAKPSELTPFSALVLAEIAHEVGIPAGVVNIITGDAGPIGEVLCHSKKVKKISFTGSTRVGKYLMRESSENVKKLSLELGGNAPFIVFEDADIDKAVEGAMASKYRNAGQTCVCTNRFFVQESIADVFIEKFKGKISKLKIGSAAEEGSDVGPLINKMASDKVERLVEDAVKKGASVWASDNLPKSKAYYSDCRVLDNVSDDAEIFQEEIFGPVSAIYRFKTEDEVLKRANNSPYGLAAYFYTNSVDRIFRVRDALEYGMVGINTGRVSSAWAPFGGVKESGFGKEGSYHGINEYLTEKMATQIYG